MIEHPNIDRDELRKLADAATAGPWELIGGCEYVTGAGVCVAPDDGGVTSADAAFIAASRQAVPELLAALEQAEAERDYRRRENAELHESWLLLSSDTATWQQRAVQAEARIKAVRELHYPAHNDQGRTPFCPGCQGAPGVHGCGCWRDEQEAPVCGHCRGWKGVGPVEYPCPTIRALDGD